MYASIVEYLAGASADALDHVLVSETRQLGRVEARAHTVVVHLLVHGIPHWAQVAMVLPQLLAAWTARDHLVQVSRVMTKQYRDAVGPWRVFLPIVER